MRLQNIQNPGVTFNPRSNRNTAAPSFKRNWAEHASWGANYVKQTGKTNFKLFSFPDAKAVFVEIADKAAVKLANVKDRLVGVLGLTSAAAATAGYSVSPVDDKSKIYPMANKGDGVFEANGIEATPNDKYRYIVVTKDNDVNLVKDPYAKKQENIHGWSSIYDSDNYKWKNTDWLEGKDPRRIVRKPNEPLRGLERLVIDEVNIPTLTKEGTFEAAKARIDEIARKGTATAIELMPVENAFSKQWGYDGVDKFAVNENLGQAEQLKELIDYSHGKGLNVIIDMVPNHMGPDGDYLSQTGPYIKGSGEFGNLLNYEGDNNRYVRDWMSNAALWWAKEFKVDGIRFDLTNRVGSDYLLRQMAVEVNEHAPEVFLIAEDHEHKRHSITSYYSPPYISHDEQLKFVDGNVENNRRGLKTSPWSIGFDSEWDSQYKESVEKSVLEPNTFALNDLDNYLRTSHYRVKYGYSHDEIGNEDGTRFIPKYIARHFNLFASVTGNSDSEKGQRAAHAAQNLAELIVSEDFEGMTNSELAKTEKALGINKFISKQELINVMETSIAKQKLMLGTVMTTPGPKMYFQGDDEADLSYFKFFRELSDDVEKRESNPSLRESIVSQKGYDTLESVARPDSVVGSVKTGGLYTTLKEENVRFNADLKKLLDSSDVLAKGEIVGTYKDNMHLVHSHHLKLGNEELLVIKNYGYGFHSNNYEYYGFPKDGNWKEIFNSDAKKYGGSGYSNAGRDDINYKNQNLSLAPNSFIILKKV